MSIKAILVDDHPLVREGVASMLAEDKGVAAVARYADTIQLLNGLKHTAADVLLLDLQDALFLNRPSQLTALPIMQKLDVKKRSVW